VTNTLKFLEKSTPWLTLIAGIILRIMPAMRVSHGVDFSKNFRVFVTLYMHPD